MYKIKIIDTIDDIDLGETANIDQYNWGGEYQPKTTAKLCFIRDFGFIIKMTCQEFNPLATALPPIGKVHLDSCLESFINFNPKVVDSPYINFEVNALGAMCCQFAPTSDERKPFLENNIPLPTVEIFKDNNQWGFILKIELAMLKLIYGDLSFTQGSILTGNFFKCGDKTHTPHYGSYTKFEFPYPSFHQPQFFSEMIITA